MSSIPLSLELAGHTWIKLVQKQGYGGTVLALGNSSVSFIPTCYTPATKEARGSLDTKGRKNPSGLGRNPALACKIPHFFSHPSAPKHHSILLVMPFYYVHTKCSHAQQWMPTFLSVAACPHPCRAAVHNLAGKGCMEQLMATSCITFCWLLAVLG